MAKVRKVRLPFVLVAAAGTSAKEHPVTAWMTTEEYSKIAFDLEVRALNGLLEVALGYQTCNVESSPDSPVAVTSYANADTLSFRSAYTSTTSNTDGKQLVRIVVLAKLSSGSTLATACVGGTLYVVEP